LLQCKPLRSSYWLLQRASQQVNCWCKHAILWSPSPGGLHCTEYVALHALDGNGPHSIQPGTFNICSSTTRLQMQVGQTCQS
jgi:hypothetical protein